MGSVISYHVQDLILKQVILAIKSMKLYIYTVKLEIVAMSEPADDMHTIPIVFQGC
jgi:hypothetical protein